MIEKTRRKGSSFVDFMSIRVKVRTHDVEI